MFSSEEETILLTKFEDLKKKLLPEKININYSKSNYANLLEYQLNLSFPNNDFNNINTNQNTPANGIESYSIDFILEIILNQKIIHLYSKNIPVISDGRDLLPSFFHTPNISFNLNELNLLSIVEHIKTFLSSISNQTLLIGKFYLGKEYDINIINSLTNLYRVSCFHVDKINEEIVSIPSLLCIGIQNVFLYEYGKRSNKNLSDEVNKFTLVFYTNLSTLISFRKSIVGSFVSLHWMKGNREYSFPLKICSDNDDDMEMVMDVLITKIKEMGKKLDIYEKKMGTLPDIDIKTVEKNIVKLENKIEHKASDAIFKKLLNAYEQAIEYYSAINDEKFIIYKNKLQALLSDEKNAEFIK